MNGHIGAERMNDLVDGLLSAAERAEVEAHLSACPACREEATRLAETVAAIGALPRDAVAPGGMWAHIERRTAGKLPGPGAVERAVLRFPAAGAGPRRIAFTVPQLAAAAGLVALLSWGVAWTAMSRGGETAPQAAAAGTMPTGRTARMVATGESYQEAVARLRMVVEQGRDRLSPETIATLERSLETIDAAITEVEEALRADPSSDLLARMLVSHQDAKLRVLRQVATRVEPRT